MMRWLAWILALLVAIGVAAGATAYLIYSHTQEAYQGFPGLETFVEIPPGTGPIGIGERLVAAGVVRDVLTFRAAVFMSGRARELKAGEYRFDHPLTANEVVTRLVRGDVYKRLITFREGLTIADMAQVFEEKGFGTAKAFVAAAANFSLIHDLDPAARDLEGYLFPETYALPRGTPAADLVAQMVEAFRRAFSAPLRAAAEQAGLPVRQAVTLAALVEKETASPGERPLVAAVYLNRLKAHMPMQADPTVVYAMMKAGRYRGNISREDLQIDSPYNTYRYPGLPPGPIAAPGLASLQAVANPAAVEYLYFVSKNDGTHAFAETLAEHNRNVFTWQVEYFRRQRQPRH
ncbi:MAG: endolytic transglycosylase MltG [Vicinamibacterales bacterium]